MKRFALKTVALLACLLCSLSAVAAEAYAEYTPENTTLTFYYDDLRSGRTGSTFDLNEGDNDPGWYSDGTRSSVTQVVFDSSFASARPTSTRRWFSKMSKLTSITGLNYFNTSEVTNMAAMFHGCSKLTSLSLTGFNTAKVTNMTSMFQNCTGLTSLNVGNFNMTNVTMLMSMFDNCSSLTSLDLSGWNTANMTNINFMFERCSSLITIYVGSGWTTNTVTSTSSVFNGCSSLVGGMGTTYDTNHLDKTYAHIDGGPSNPGYFTEKQKGPYACYTPENTTLTFYYDNQRSTRSGTTYELNTGANYPGWVDDYTDLSVTQVVFDPSFADARPTTTAYWFFEMIYLESIIGMEDYLNTSEVTNMHSMFYCCTCLTSLDLSSFNTANVTDMSVMFSGCEALTSLDVANFNTANVTNMESMFGFCSSLTSLDLSSFNTANVTDMAGMFGRCRGLTSLDLSSFNTANVTNMNYMFRICSALTTIYAGRGWNTAAVTYSSDMFDGCTNLVGGKGTIYDYNHVDKTYAHIDGGASNPGYLTDINVPDEAYACYMSDNTTLTFYYDNQRRTRPGTTYDLNEDNNSPAWYSIHSSVTSVVFDPSFAGARPTSTSYWFTYMNKVTSITGMKEYLNTSEVTTMRGMFKNCPELTSLDLSSFNTANVTDMCYMFYECFALTCLDLSSFNTANVKSMYNMFYRCNNLTTIYAGSEWSTENITGYSVLFDGCLNILGSMGTAYDYQHTDIDYAHIDGGPDNPGYLSDFIDTYAVYTPENTTLTFYYDKLKDSRTGTVYDMPEPNTYPGWYSDGTNSNITQAVFDPSFAYARPTSTSRWFYYLSNLRSITGMNYLNTSRVTNMGSMFEGCSNLTSIDVSNFVTDNVTDMAAMFYQCRRLASLDVTNFNTANVTNMHGMFTGLRNITNLDLSNFNTANVTSMDFMFSSCVALTTLNLGSFNTAKVKGMQRMFNGCSALTTICVTSGWNTDIVTNHSDMFLNCPNLVGGMGTTYDANHVDKAYAHIDGGTSNPGYLTETQVPYAVYTSEDSTLTFYFDALKHTRPGTATYDMNRGKNLPDWLDMKYIFKRVVFDPSFAGARPKSTYGWFYQMYNNMAITGTEYLNTSEVTDMSYMFSECTNLTSLDLSGFNTANVTDMSYMFSRCYALASLDVSSFNTANVTDMNSLFNFCYALTSLDLSSFNTAKVTNMNSLFNCCYNLADLDISSFNTDNVTDMYCMFSCTNSLTSIDVSNFNTDNVTDMGYMFSNTYCITSLDVTNFNTANVTNMEGMFYKCDALTCLDLSNFNTANVTDMDYMFRYCTGLTTIYAGSGWNTDAVIDSYNMFNYCTNIKGDMGTTYDYNHVDKAYAHIDGGTSNPGYLSRFLLGDVNGDGKVNIGDVTAVIDYILYGDEVGFNYHAADVNRDGIVNIADGTAIIDYILYGTWD